MAKQRPPPQQLSSVGECCHGVLSHSAPSDHLPPEEMSGLGYSALRMGRSEGGGSGGLVVRVEMFKD